MRQCFPHNASANDCDLVVRTWLCMTPTASDGVNGPRQHSLAVSIPFFSSYCTSRLFLTFVWATRLGFTSPTFVQLDLFPHLRLLTLCLASSASAWHVLGFPSLTHLAPFGLGLSVPALASLQLCSWPHPLLSNWHAASPEKYFCSASAGSRLTKRKKKLQNRKNRGKKIAPTADMGGVLWQINIRTERCL